MRAFALLFVGLILVGCQTTTMDTASGGPEVTIRNARPDQIKPAIVSAMLNTRFRIKTDTQYSLVFEKNDDSVLRAVLLGTNYGPPADRVNFAIAEVPGGTRVVADSATISNSGSAFERKGGFAPDFPPERLQAMLNELAISVTPPPVASLPSVVPRQPAQKRPARRTPVASADPPA